MRDRSWPSGSTSIRAARQYQLEAQPEDQCDRRSRHLHRHRHHRPRPWLSVISGAVTTLHQVQADRLLRIVPVIGIAYI